MDTFYSLYGDSPLIAFLCIACGISALFLAAFMIGAALPMRRWLALAGLAFIAAFPAYTALTRYVFT